MRQCFMTPHGGCYQMRVKWMEVNSLAVNKKKLTREKWQTVQSYTDLSEAELCMTTFHSSQLSIFIL